MSKLSLPMFVALSSLALHAACSDLSTPADLDREQILAVRATPSVLIPGESVVLDTLIAGPDGPLVGTERWQVPSAIPGISLQENAAGRAILSCAEGVVASDQSVELQLSIELADGQVLLAQKSVALEDREAANPVITALRIGGQETEEAATLSIGAGEIEISVESEAATRVAWYTSLGEIRYYRDAETVLEVLPEDLGEGWIAAVVRDDEGGVSWRSVNLQAE